VSGRAHRRCCPAKPPGRLLEDQGSPVRRNGGQNPCQAHLPFPALGFRQDDRVPRRRATNQFPRACDLAHTFRRAGLTVLIGGFTSALPRPSPGYPSRYTATPGRGCHHREREVEETWGDLLDDAVSRPPKALYDFLNNKPDLYTKPIPAIRKKYLRKFAASNFGTLDCGRGCPFECTFCTISTSRAARCAPLREHIAESIRRNYHENGITSISSPTIILPATKIGKLFSTSSFACAPRKNSRAIHDAGRRPLLEN